MANSVKQYYGITFPFTENNTEELFLDLNTEIKSKVGSELLHLILTQKGTRIRRPDFGTNLVNYIFDLNDELTWDSVEEEIRTAVGTYIPNVKINEIKVVKNENENHEMYLDIKFSVIKGMTVENNRIVVKI